MMKILTIAWFGVLVLALILSGAIPRSLSSHSGEPSSANSGDMRAGTTSVITGKTLVIAMSSDVDTMDPSKTSAMYGPPGIVLETLITRDKTGAYQPGLATSYSWNLNDPNHPRFVIQLKHGVKFQDATPFNAQAVKDDVKWYKQSDMYGSYGWVAYEFAAIDCSNSTSDWGNMDQGIWVQDDYNLVFNCTYYDAALIFNLSHLYGSMMSPTAAFGSGATLAEAHADYGTPNHPAVGTGPFMITEWVPGDHVTLVKFNDYNWGFDWYVNKGPAKIDRIIYRIIPDDATRFAGFESGNIDVLMQVPPSKVQTYAGDPSKYTVITGQGQGTYHIEFNCQKVPWTSVDLRRAFGFAIDRDAIVSAVWHGYAAPGVNYLSPILPEGALIPAQYNYSFNLTKASQLFAAAGWIKNGNGWLENTTTHVELTLPLWTTNKGEDVMMSEMLQSQLQTAGVHVTLTQFNEDTLRAMAAAGLDDAMLFWYSWPRAEILDWHFGTWAIGGSNTAQFSDPAFDMYVVNWTYAPSEADFSQNATRAHERLLELGPWAPVIFWHQIAAVHNNVTGWYVHPLGQEQVIDIVDVDITAPPHAVAVVTPNPAVVGGTVTFDARTSSDDVGIVNWTWSFSDGGVPVHLWDEVAAYTVHNGLQNIDVTLTVRDGDGNTNSSTVTLAVTNVIPEFAMVPFVGVVLMAAIVIAGGMRRKRDSSR